MAEEIIYKITVDGTDENVKNLNYLQEALNELGRQKTALSKKTSDLAKEFDKLSAETADAQKALKAVDAAYKAGDIGAEDYQTSVNNLNYTIQANEAQLEAITQQQYETAAAQVELKLETQELNKEYKVNQKAINDAADANAANEGSIEQMRIELRNAQQEYVKLSKAERENAAVGGALLTSIQQQDKALKDLESSIGINQRSVGDYGKAIQGTLPLMGGFGQQIQTVIGNLGQIKTAITGFASANKAAAGATATTTTGLKAFRAALIGTGIGAIVVALGSLIAAFASTQRGMDAINRVLIPIKEAFKTLVGFLQNQAFAAFDKLKWAIQNPKQAVIDLGNALKENLVNRFKGIIGTFVSYGEFLINSWKVIGLRFKKAVAGVPILGGGIDVKKLDKDLKEAEGKVKQSAKKLANNALQVVTGVENVIDKVADAGKAASAALKESNARAEKMYQLQKQIETAEITLNREKEKGNRLFVEAKEIAQNTLLTDKERLAAAAEAKKALEDVRKLEVEQLNRKIELKKLSQQANDTDREGQKELQDLIAERERAEADAIQKSIEVGNMANGIRKAARDKELAEIKAHNEAVEAANLELIKANEEAENEAFLRSLKSEEEKEIAVQTFKENARKSEIEASIADEQLKQRALSELQLSGEQERAEIREKHRIENRKKEIDEEIRTIELQNQLELSKGEVKDDEKLAREFTMQEKIGKLRYEQAELNGENLNNVELENRIALNELLLEEENRFKETLGQVRDAGFQAATMFGEAFLDNRKRQIDAEKQREIDALKQKKDAGVITQEEFEKERERIDRKAFEAQKKASISRAIINGALAVTQEFATKGLAGIITGAILTAKTALEVAAISNQSFAKGGFTGEGFGTPDSSGFKVAGVVHEGEYVVPNNVLSSGQGRQLVGKLESLRMGNPPVSSLGFANGGFTSSPAASVDFSNIEARIANAVANSVGSLKVKNVASDTTGLDNRVNEIKILNSF